MGLLGGAGQSSRLNYQAYTTAKVEFHTTHLGHFMSSNLKESGPLASPEPIEVLALSEVADLAPELELTAEETLGPLRALHRGTEGYIGFTASRSGGGFDNLFSLQMSALEAMFPSVAQWLIQDAFFTVNSMHRAAPYNSKLTGLPGVWRKEKFLRYLNACYVDLDVGRDLSGVEGSEALTWRDASAFVGNLMDSGHLPQCSLFARSGRGVYVFWLLHDEEHPNLPPRYWPEKLALYKKVNQALGDKLRSMAYDTKSFDGARVLRVPGTRHSKSGECAHYFIQSDGRGNPFSYTLGDLAHRVGVQELHVSLPLLTRNLAGERSLEDRPAGDGLDRSKCTESAPVEWTRS